MEERLEDRVAEAEGQQVLHRLLAEIMVDAVNLIGPQETHDLPVEGQGAGQVVAKRLLDDHARPRFFFLLGSQARGRQIFDGRAKILRISRKVKETVARKARLSLNGSEPFTQIAHAVGGRQIRRQVVHMGEKIVRGGFVHFAKRGLHIGPKSAIFLGPSADADNGEILGQIAAFP